MNPAESKLEATREAIADLIKALPFIVADGGATEEEIAALPVVLTHKTGNMLAKLDQRLGELGLAIVVSIGSAKEGAAQTRRISWDPARFWIDVCELVLIHSPEGDQPGAWAYAEAIVAEIKYAELGDNLLLSIGKEDLEEINPRPDQNPDLLIVRIPITTRLAGNNAA